jgi:UDP-sugar transporter A1/2/3
MLEKTLRGPQKLAICLLTLGIIIVQTSGLTFTPSTIEDSKVSATNMAAVLTGSLALITATSSSGFASCYFESRVKNSDLWIRNVQLSLFGACFSYMLMIAETSYLLEGVGIFHGFNGWVWFVILGQALGGIMVAMVLKYADSILKTLASCVAILLCSVLSIWLFETEANVQLFFGVFISTSGIWLYIK